MATQIRTNLPAILVSLKTQLETVLQFPSARVVLRKSWEPLFPPESSLPSLNADQICVIRPRSALTDRGILLGAGRVDTRLERTVTIVCWSRLNIDYAGQDYSWLLDPDYGELYFEQAVLDALSTWLPLDSTQNALAFPGRLGRVAEPVPDKDDWGHSECDFSFTYALALNQSRQW